MRAVFLSNLDPKHVKSCIRPFVDRILKGKEYIPVASQQGCVYLPDIGTQRFLYYYLWLQKEALAFKVSLMHSYSSLNIKITLYIN